MNSIITALIVYASITNGERFESIDSHTFSIYTADWSSLHEKWMNIDSAENYCDDMTENTVYPLCFLDKIIQESYFKHDIISAEQCPSLICAKNLGRNMPCSYTPFDTIDYLPPLPDHSLDNKTICPGFFSMNHDYLLSKSSYGMDLGIPPFYLPIVPVRLNITGTVSTQSNGQCVPISGAEITAWQINPMSLMPFTSHHQSIHSKYLASIKAAAIARSPYSNSTIEDIITDLPNAQTAQTKVSSHTKSLRELTCTARQHTSGGNNDAYTFSNNNNNFANGLNSKDATNDDDAAHTTEAEGRSGIASTGVGNFQFFTLMPPSYGPPRHIMFTVTAPGYQTLTTRMYFDKDLRLQQLTTLAKKGGSNIDSFQDYDSLSLALGFPTDPGNHSTSIFPGAVAKDPRVAKLRFIPTSTSSSSSDSDNGLVAGYFETEFNIVLQPLRPDIATTTTTHGTMLLSNNYYYICCFLQQYILIYLYV